MEESLKDLDMLEQINVTCDMELLNMYLRDLNELKYGLNDDSFIHQFVIPGNAEASGTSFNLKPKTTSVNKIPFKPKPIRKADKRFVPKLLFASTAILILLLSGYAILNYSDILDRLIGKPNVMNPDVSGTPLNETFVENNDSGSPANEFEPAEKPLQLIIDQPSVEIASSSTASDLNENESGERVLQENVVETNSSKGLKTSDGLESKISTSAPKSGIELEEALFQRLVSDRSARYDRQATVQSTQGEKTTKSASAARTGDVENQVKKPESETCFTHDINRKSEKRKGDT